MSEELRNKLVQYETPPPAEVWHKIVHELDDALPYQHVAERLSTYEITPPKEIWSNIARDLDEIQSLKGIEEKLLNYEAAPPPGIFKNITDALDNELPAKVVPIRKITPFYKMAVAAAAIIVVASTALWLFNTKNKSQTIASNLDPNRPVTTANKGHADTNESITAAELKSLLKHATNDKPSRIEVLSEPNSITTAPGNDAFTRQGEVKLNPPHVKSISDLAAKVVTTSNYITYLGADGELKKISSKIFRAAYSYNFNDSAPAEGSLHHTDLIENLLWKTKFAEWRNKIIQSSLAPNSINGMDILDLKDLIREN